jgi:hypothetical protein
MHGLPVLSTQDDYLMHLCGWRLTEPQPDASSSSICSWPKHILMRSICSWPKHADGKMASWSLAIVTQRGTHWRSGVQGRQLAVGPRDCAVRTPAAAAALLAAAAAAAVGVLPAVLLPADRQGGGPIQLPAGRLQVIQRGIVGAELRQVPRRALDVRPRGPRAAVLAAAARGRCCRAYMSKMYSVGTMTLPDVTWCLQVRARWHAATAAQASCDGSACFQERAACKPHLTRGTAARTLRCWPRTAGPTPGS